MDSSSWLDAFSLFDFEFNTFTVLYRLLLLSAEMAFFVFHIVRLNREQRNEKGLSLSESTIEVTAFFHRPSMGVLNFSRESALLKLYPPS